MPRVGRRLVALALEDMAEMRSAAAAQDLGARHKHGPVAVLGDGAGDALKEGRPAAAAVELGRAAIDRRAARSAPIDALLRMVVVLTGARGVGALLAQHAELLGREDCAPFLRRLVHAHPVRRLGKRSKVEGE